MYSKDLKEYAKKIKNVNIPKSFKYGIFENGFDMMELYEELFDYSYEIEKELPLASNFSLFCSNKEEVIKQLNIILKGYSDLSEICEICYSFCILLKDIL